MLICAKEEEKRGAILITGLQATNLKIVLHYNTDNTGK